MFCRRCWAELNETDKFCSQCGAPVRRPKTHPEKNIYYDEKLYRDDKGLYRDTFLKKKEEKSHALLTTVAVLLVIAVLTVGGLALLFFLKKSGGSENKENGQATTSDVVILDEGGQDALPDGTPEEETETPETGVEEENGTEAETKERVVVETEPETEAAHETERMESEARIREDRMEEFFSSGSTALKSAVCVYDLDHNQVYGAGEWESPMYASALISVPILYTAAVKLDRQEITLNDEILYVNSIGGRGETDPEEKDGKRFPLSYYLTTMLAYSDNNCMNCLIDFLGLSEINRICREAGFSSVDLQRKIVAEVTDGKDNYLSAKDAAGMVKELYGGKYQTISNTFMKNYFRIDPGDGYRTVIGLAQDLPEDALFLNQNGRGDTRYSEVAVISDGACQYVISVMCSGEYGFQYETAVENISNYVYQSLN